MIILLTILIFFRFLINLNINIKKRFIKFRNLNSIEWGGYIFNKITKLNFFILLKISNFEELTLNYSYSNILLKEYFLDLYYQIIYYYVFFLISFLIIIICSLFLFNKYNKFIIDLQFIIKYEYSDNFGTYFYNYKKEKLFFSSYFKNQGIRGQRLLVHQPRERFLIIPFMEGPDLPDPNEGFLKRIFKNIRQNSTDIIYFLDENKFMITFGIFIIFTTIGGVYFFINYKESPEQIVARFKQIMDDPAYSNIFSRPNIRNSSFFYNRNHFSSLFYQYLTFDEDYYSYRQNLIDNISFNIKSKDEFLKGQYFFYNTLHKDCFVKMIQNCFKIQKITKDQFNIMQEFDREMHGILGINFNFFQTLFNENLNFVLKEIDNNIYLNSLQKHQESVGKIIILNIYLLIKYNYFTEIIMSGDFNIKDKQKYILEFLDIISTIKSKNTEYLKDLDVLNISYFGLNISLKELTFFKQNVKDIQEISLMIDKQINYLVILIENEILIEKKQENLYNKLTLNYNTLNKKLLSLIKSDNNLMNLADFYTNEGKLFNKKIILQKRYTQFKLQINDIRTLIIDLNDLLHLFNIELSTKLSTKNKFLMNLKMRKIFIPETFKNCYDSFWLDKYFKEKKDFKNEREYSKFIQFDEEFLNNIVNEHTKGIYNFFMEQSKINLSQNAKDSLDGLKPVLTIAYKNQKLIRAQDIVSNVLIINPENISHVLKTKKMLWDLRDSLHLYILARVDNIIIKINLNNISYQEKINLISELKMLFQNFSKLHMESFNTHKFHFVELVKNSEKYNQISFIKYTDEKHEQGYIEYEKQLKKMLNEISDQIDDINDFIVNELDYKNECQESLKDLELISKEKLQSIDNYFIKTYIQLKFDDNNVQFKIGDLFYKKYLIDKLVFLEVEFEKLYTFYTVSNLDTELNMLKLKISKKN